MHFLVQRCLLDRMFKIKNRPRIDKAHLSQTACFLANHPVMTGEFGDLENGCEDRALAAYVGFWLAGYDVRIHRIEMGENPDGSKGEIVPLGEDGKPLRRTDSKTGETVQVGWQRHFFVSLGNMFWDPAVSEQPVPMRKLRKYYKIPRKAYIGDATRSFMRDLAGSAEGHLKKLFPNGPAADNAFRPLQRKTDLIVPHVYD